MYGILILNVWIPYFYKWFSRLIFSFNEKHFKALIHSIMFNCPLIMFNFNWKLSQKSTNELEFCGSAKNVQICQNNVRDSRSQDHGFLELWSIAIIPPSYGDKECWILTNFQQIETWKYIWEWSETVSNLTQNMVFKDII